MIENISSSALSLVPGANVQKSNDPAKIREAAKQFESLLIAELLKSARAEGGSGWLGTDEQEAGQTSVEMGEEQFARMLASSGGLGLSRMIEAGLKSDSAKAELNGAH
jgi:Rod binding domain-containing protein